MDELEVRKIRNVARSLRTDLGQLDELMASIEETGLLQPLVVRPVENGYEVVAGSRRLEACRRLRRTKVACHVVELSDKEAYEVALVENVQRKTLDPVEEAEAFRRYVDDYGYGGVTELSRKIGKSEQYVSQRLQLLRLPKDLLEKVSTRVVTPSHARELIGLDEEAQREVMESISDEQLTTREVRAITRRIRSRGLADSDPSLRPYEYSEKDRRIRTIDRAVMSCVASMRISMFRFDEALEHLGEEEWVIRESILQYRTLLHKQIDRLLTLRKKIRYDIDSRSWN